MPLTIRAYHSWDELRGLTGQWARLLDRYPFSSTFNTQTWLETWWQNFGKDRELLVLAAFDKDQRLSGLAPLAISQEKAGFLSFRVLRLLGDGSGDSDNLDVIVLPELEKEFSPLVIDYLKRNREGWQICEFNTMPSGSFVGNHILKCLPSYWSLFNYQSVCSSIALPKTWDEYVQSLSSEDRKNLERYNRRLQNRYRVQIYRCENQDQIRPALDALFRLHQLRWQQVGEPGSFGSEERRHMYEHLSKRLLEQRCLELWVLELDKTIAAVQFAFRFRDTVFQLQEGNDPQHSSDRVGFLLRGEVVQRLIGERVKKYDFLGGADVYKARWGAKENNYLNIHFAPTRSIGGTYLRTLNFARKSKNVLRDRMPKPAWDVLHRVNLGLRSMRGSD